MSREFKKREKIVHKMTKNGLAERNILTGDIENISGREKDFSFNNKPDGKGINLNRKRDRKAARQSRKLKKRRNPQRPQSQQDFDNRPDIRNNTGDIILSSKYDTPVNNEPMEAANPEQRSHDARSHEISAGTSKRRKRKNISKETAQNSASPSYDNNPVEQSVKSVPTAQKPVSDVIQPDIQKSSQSNNIKPVKISEKSSKLKFSNGEKNPNGIATPDNKNLSRIKNNTDKYNIKLEKPQDILPSKTNFAKSRVVNRTAGNVKARPRLQFERKNMPFNTQKNTLSAPGKFTKKGIDSIKRFGADKFRQKLYETENENTGLKAVHSVEKSVKGVHNTVNKIPQFQSNIFSRYMQKRKIKRQYAQAKKKAKKTGEAMKKTGDATAKAVKTVTNTIIKHPVISVVIIIILLFVFFFMSMCSGLGGMGEIDFGSFNDPAYYTSKIEFMQAETDYVEWENELRLLISNIETDYPDYDEYRYNIDAIGHNPADLMIYLSLIYGDFQYADIQANLRGIFDEQYKLSIVETVETRYSGGEPYEWRVLTVTLTVTPFFK